MKRLRAHLSLTGRVQGIGFRPFVYRLATELSMTGSVGNSPLGVEIDIEGPESRLAEFMLRLTRECPPLSRIDKIERIGHELAGFSSFVIRPSSLDGEKFASLTPDLATCETCLGEMRDPANRRYRYPFINCAQCGPRFSIIEGLPYDRARTTMKRFQQCEECHLEYTSPKDRRFHAEPNACRHCGPTLEYWDRNGHIVAKGEAAIATAIAAMGSGDVVGVKGVGGFHLMVDATNREALAALRQSKCRPAKPFALLYPSLATVRRDCEVSNLEASLLASPEAPIVLLRKKTATCLVAEEVAPRNPYLGVFLPSNPIHHLLMDTLASPVVATSGNLGDEPICIDEREALGRLGKIASGFLVHDRPISRHADDSIVREVYDRPLVLRRGRGLAPLTVRNLQPTETILALGGYLKSTMALSFSDQILLSQHIGDLSTPLALDAFQRSISDFTQLYDREPVAVVCDLHPDYASTRAAEAFGLPTIKVQHHYAHALSCLADNQKNPPALAVTWDGTGFGTDGTIWGGEFLRLAHRSFERVATLHPFRLLGGEAAIRDGRRIALSLLYEARDGQLDPATIGEELEIAHRELPIFMQMLREGIQSPFTSSVGRLFDGVAALLGICRRSSFEGEAASSLEYTAMASEPCGFYEFSLSEEETLRIDWRSMVSAIVEDKSRGVSVARIASKFHNTLVEIVVQVAKSSNEKRIALTGGCFQNRILLERAVSVLAAEGFEPLWHKDIPPNDGGLALGQIVAASLAAQGSATCA